jgi:hypothetical protein
MREEERRSGSVYSKHFMLATHLQPPCNLFSAPTCGVVVQSGVQQPPGRRNDPTDILWVDRIHVQRYE